MRQETYDWGDVESAIETYSATLYKIAYSYTGNREDSEDVLQDVFIKFARQGKFNDEEHKKAWLIRVTINQSINLTKSAHKKKNVAWDESEKQLISKAAEPGMEENLKTMVMDLPVKYRAAIYLYYYEGYKVEEIAGILNKRQASVYTLLNRGREMLKKILEEGGSNNE